MAFHKFIGEDRASFELRSNLGGTQQRQSALREFVRDPQDQRKFWANDRQVGSQLGRHIRRGRHVIHFERQALCVAGNAGISGRTPNLFNRRALTKLPDDTVFPCAAADDKYLQNVFRWELKTIRGDFVCVNHRIDNKKFNANYRPLRKLEHITC